MLISPVIFWLAENDSDQRFQDESVQIQTVNPLNPAALQGYKYAMHMFILSNLP